MMKEVKKKNEKDQREREMLRLQKEKEDLENRLQRLRERVLREEGDK
jgi:hypothetical protein